MNLSSRLRNLHDEKCLYIDDAFKALIIDHDQLKLSVVLHGSALVYM